MLVYNVRIIQKQPKQGTIVLPYVLYAKNVPFLFHSWPVVVFDYSRDKPLLLCGRLLSQLVSRWGDEEEGGRKKESSNFWAFFDFPLGTFFYYYYNYYNYYYYYDFNYYYYYYYHYLQEGRSCG